MCYVPKTFPAPPKDTLPPDGATHQLYVQQLHMYLVYVVRNPQAFQMEVNQRRERFFGDAWIGSATSHKSQVRVHPVLDTDTDTEANWLSLGP